MPRKVTHWNISCLQAHAIANYQFNTFP